MSHNILVEMSGAKETMEKNKGIAEAAEMREVRGMCGRPLVRVDGRGEWLVEGDYKEDAED